MNEMTAKRKLAAALREPSAPPGLVERTVVRAQALAAGREAEQRLERDSNLSRTEYMNLAAQSVVGRLMLKRMPPVNTSVEAMWKHLQENDAFCRVTDQPPKSFLSEVRNGTLLRKLGEAAQGGKQPAAVEKQDAPKIVKGGNGPTL